MAACPALETDRQDLPPRKGRHKSRGSWRHCGKAREAAEIDEEELAAVQLESTHTIDIDSFVPRSEIDNRYLDRPYCLVPEAKGRSTPVIADPF